MAKIKILTTPDCGSCAKVERMLNELKVKYEVIDITKHPEVLKKYPIMTAPGVVINGKLEFIGVPSKEDLKKKIKWKNMT